MSAALPGSRPPNSSHCFHHLHGQCCFFLLLVGQRELAESLALVSCCFLPGPGSRVGRSPSGTCGAASSGCQLFLASTLWYSWIIALCFPCSEVFGVQERLGYLRPLPGRGFGDPGTGALAGGGNGAHEGLGRGGAGFSEAACGGRVGPAWRNSAGVWLPRSWAVCLLFWAWAENASHAEF